MIGLVASNRTSILSASCQIHAHEENCSTGHAAIMDALAQQKQRIDAFEALSSFKTGGLKYAQNTHSAASNFRLFNGFLPLENKEEDSVHQALMDVEMNGVTQDS